GLGLAIVRHLTELHGGTVSAASDGEGKGATFTLRLRLADQRAEFGSHATATQETDAKLTGLRVLLVEDEPDAREMLTLTLTDSGANVQAVDSVQQAMINLKTFKPDVLLSDIGLPLESGYD